MDDPVRGIIMLLLGVVFTLLLILAWAEIYGGGWQQVAQGVALGSIFIVVFGVVFAGIVLLARRR